MDVYEIMGLTKTEYEELLKTAINRHPEYEQGVLRAMEQALKIWHDYYCPEALARDWASASSKRFFEEANFLENNDLGFTFRV